jgi:uncharacterized membrane protein (DUF4010 family)
MGMTTAPPILQLLLAVALGFFLGLAFEEFHARSNERRPGGIRTFPLLALVGALLFQLDPAHFIPFSVGLLALGAWLTCFYWQHLRETDAEGFPNVGLMVPTCNVLAYLLGPVALTEPPWAAVGATVAGVLFLTSRAGLHDLARRIELSEIVNAGRFLLLTGFALPLLPNTPVTELTSVTPRQVWLAMVAVCSVSYASYLLQRYVAPASGTLLAALLGGVYSSTATTVVLARRVRTNSLGVQEAQTGIILATSVMYPRLLIVVWLFNHPLALALAPILLGLSALGFLLAGAWHWVGRERQKAVAPIAPPANPLGLGTAATFALLFVAVSIASYWAEQQFGTAGVYTLAALVGISDINPFVLSLAQHGGGMTSSVGATAIVVATASNNLFQAGYATAYSGGRTGWVPPVTLAALAACGIGLAVVLR